VSAVHDRVMAALAEVVERRLDEVEDWQHQQRIARAVLDALGLRTEYAWAPDDDLGSLFISDRGSAESKAKSYGGAVYVREVTDWRPEAGE